mgnify:CR=1 FL=1
MLPRSLTALAALGMALLASPASASEVRVGEMRVPIVDGFAVAGDFFGKTSLELYLFSRRLEPGVKTALGSEKLLSARTVTKVAGVAPVLNLMFFFDQDATACDLSKLLSYTAVFQRTRAFPFAAATDAPVNFSITNSDHGITVLACEFTTGSPVRVKLGRSWNADRGMFPTLLPPERDRLLFSWDVDFAGELVRGKRR